MFVYIPNFFIIDIFLLLIKNLRIRDFSLLLLRSNWKDKNPHRFAMLLFLSHSRVEYEKYNFYHSPILDKFLNVDMFRS